MIDVPTREEVAAMEAEGRRKHSGKAIGMMIAGLLLFLVGAGVTVFSHLAAAGQEAAVVVVWYGPILTGAALFLVGAVLVTMERREARRRQQFDDLFRTGP